MPRPHLTHDDFEDGLDEPDLPRCAHCKGTVCTYDGCTPDNHCPHGGKGVQRADGTWVCASSACQSSSLLPGEFPMRITETGPRASGKTTRLVARANAAVAAGKRVVFLNCELGLDPRIPIVQGADEEAVEISEGLCH